MLHIEYWKKRNSRLDLIHKDTSHSYYELTLTFEIEKDKISREVLYKDNHYQGWNIGSFALGSIIPDIIQLLTESDQSSVLYAQGPLTLEGLLSILPYMCHYNFPGAYSLSGGNKPEGSCYTSGRVSYDFHYDWVKRMLADEEMPFQVEVQFAGVVIPKALKEEAIKNNYFSSIPESVDRVIDIAEIVFEADRDFEYFRIYSKTKTSDDILDIIKKRFLEQYQFVEISR